MSWVVGHDWGGNRIEAFRLTQTTDIERRYLSQSYLHKLLFSYTNNNVCDFVYNNRYIIFCLGK